MLVARSRRMPAPAWRAMEFTVCSSEGSPFPAKVLKRPLCSTAAADDHLPVSRLACHSDFASRRAAYRCWTVPPRPSPSTARISVRSLIEDGGPEGEVELKSSFRTLRPASAKGRRTVNKASGSIKKIQQRSSVDEELPPSAEKQSKRVVSKPTNYDFGGEEEWSGNEALDGRGPAFRGLNNLSEKLEAELVVVGSEIRKSNIPKPGGKLSRARNSVTSSRSSAVPSASLIVRRDRKVGPKDGPAVSSAMNSNGNSGRRDTKAGDQSKPRLPTEKKPRKKDFPVEALLRRDLNNCSKEGDVLRALDIYERSVSEGIVKWNQYNFNILLYLCSSAALGTLCSRESAADRLNSEKLNFKSSEENVAGALPLESAEGVEQLDGVRNGEATTGEGPTTTLIHLSPEVMELAAQRGFEIFEDMKKQGVPPNEATLTAVARLAVWREDGDLAFQMVKEMAAQNIAPKLRSYSPALTTFCKSKAVEKAFEVDAHMVAAGVQPEEPELGTLLQLCVEERLDKQVYSLLHRLRMGVRALSASTISSVEEWFAGQAGASAVAREKQPDISAVQHAMVAGGGGWHGLGWLGQGEWKLEWTTIDSQGFCRSCRNKLVTIDLDRKETDNFAKSVAELAFARETKSQEFKKFQEWLERNGPFDAIIDGANVGLYNQNFQQGGFNFFQLNSVAQAAVDRGLVKKPPLIILHQARTKFGAANSSLGQQLLRKWSSLNQLYTTPNGSNDDWYWLYAAVRNKCLLITNDEMRDHLFQLLGSDFFPKWKERHQVRFSATTRGPQFHLPPPYSLVIQEAENGSWHIPKDRGSDVDAPHEWMCVTRPSPGNAALLASESTTQAETVSIPTQTPHDGGGQGSESDLCQTRLTTV